MSSFFKPRVEAVFLLSEESNSSAAAILLLTRRIVLDETVQDDSLAVLVEIKECRRFAFRCVAVMPVEKISIGEMGELAVLKKLF